MEIMELGTDHVPMIVSGIRVQDIFIGQQSVEHIADAFTLLIGEPDIQFHDDASSPKYERTVESRYRGSDACHAPDDFMAWDHGEHRTAPFVSRLMDVGVADSAVRNFDEHVVRTQVTSLEVEWFERRRRACGCISACREHGVTSCYVDSPIANTFFRVAFMGPPASQCFVELDDRYQMQSMGSGERQFRLKKVSLGDQNV